MRSKIGITGGSGYIGHSLAKYLSNNFYVKVLDVKRPHTSNENIHYSFCDVKDRAVVEKELRDVDLVIHSAIIQIPLINEQKKLGYEVNIIGTQNVCEVVKENPNIKGMILTGSWHTIGENELEDINNMNLGFKLDKVEERGRLYAVSKIVQESILKFYSEMSDKIFGVIRMGTVLGIDMPDKTAVKIFIEKGIKEEIISPYKHSMYRPMLYIDIDDVCKAYYNYANIILDDYILDNDVFTNSVMDLYYPEPINIMEVSKIIKNAIIKYTDNTIYPKIKIINTGQKSLYNKNKKIIKYDITRSMNFLGINTLKSPKESIENIVNKIISRVLIK